MKGWSKREEKEIGIIVIYILVCLIIVFINH